MKHTPQQTPVSQELHPDVVCTATVISVLVKSDSACERCSGLTIKKVFEEFGKYSKAGPAETTILTVQKEFQQQWHHQQTIPEKHQ